MRAGMMKGKIVGWLLVTASVLLSVYFVVKLFVLLNRLGPGVFLNSFSLVT